MPQVTTEALSDSPHEKNRRKNKTDECGRQTMVLLLPMSGLWFMGVDIRLVLPAELRSSSRTAGWQSNETAGSEAGQLGRTELDRSRLLTWVQMLTMLPTMSLGKTLTLLCCVWEDNSIYPWNSTQHIVSSLSAQYRSEGHVVQWLGAR